MNERAVEKRCIFERSKVKTPNLKGMNGNNYHPAQLQFGIELHAVMMVVVVVDVGEEKEKPSGWNYGDDGDGGPKLERCYPRVY